ncbi:MAG: penicillin-binding protein activator [Magnetococcales bacterium]|nr:penicillin-binding protein activator [Magnetococcales bacterium]
MIRLALLRLFYKPRAAYLALLLPVVLLTSACSLDSTGTDAVKKTADKPPAIKKQVKKAPTPKLPPGPSPAEQAAEQLLFQGDQFTLDDQLDQAIFAFQQLIKRYPETPFVSEALVRLADIHLRRNERQAAERALQSAARYVKHPAADRAAWKLAMLYDHDGDQERAWPYWARLAKAGQFQHQGAWARLIDSYFSTGSKDNSIIFLRNLPQTNLEQPQLRHFLNAATFQTQTRLEDLLSFQPASSPLRRPLHLILGDKLAENQQLDEAKKHWKKAAGLPGEASPVNSADEQSSSESQDTIPPSSTDLLGALMLQADSAFNTDQTNDLLPDHESPLENSDRDTLPETSRSQLKQEALIRLGETVSSETPLHVGLLLPLTSRYARLGQNLIQGALQALSDYRDVSITLRVEDTGGEPQSAQDAFHRLMDGDVDLIIGPLVHDAAQAVIPLARRQGIPLIALNPHLELLQAGEVAPNEGVDSAPVFLNAFHPTHQAHVMARHAVQIAQRQRFAILAPDSDFGTLMTQAFTEKVESLGGSVVRVVRFPANTRDYSDSIKALAHLSKESTKQRIRLVWKSPSLDPSDPTRPQQERDLEPWVDFDALFLPVSAEQVRLIAPQASFFNIRMPDVAFLGVSLWNQPDKLLSEGTDYLQGAVFCDSGQQERSHFQAVFSSIWTQPPYSITHLVYDSVALLAQLRRDERLGGPEWQAGMTRPMGFIGSSGQLQLLESGLSQRHYQLLQIQREGIVPLTSALHATDKRTNPL